MRVNRLFLDRSDSVLIGSLLFVAACAGTEGLDSAGVAEWSLTPIPTVSIGVAEGDDRYMFRRITGALLLPGGRVLVSDVEPTLSIFDSTGAFVQRVGRKGSGPGEFQMLLASPIRYRGDSILIWDLVAGRVSIFDDAGRFGRAFNWNRASYGWAKGTVPEQSCCIMRAALGNGDPVLEFPGAIPNQPGPDRVSTVMLLRLTPDGAVRDTIGAFDSGWYKYDATRPSSIQGLRLSGRFSYVAIGDTIIGGSGNGPWLLRVAPGGAVDTIHLPVSPVPVTDSIKQAFADAYRAEYRRSPERFEGPPERLFDGKYVSHVPAYGPLRADNAGRLWLTEWRLPYSSDSLRLNVYSGRGAHVARIAIPSGVRIADIRGDRIALIGTDSLGIESVRVHDIIRRP